MLKNIKNEKNELFDTKPLNLKQKMSEEDFGKFIQEGNNEIPIGEVCFSSDLTQPELDPLKGLLR